MSNKSNNQDLQRKIGLFSLVGLGVGATVGAGIFSTISEVASIAGSGLFLVLALLIGALFQIPGSFCYAELTSAYPVDGGHYIYFKEAGLKMTTFIFGWLTFLAIDGPGVAVMALAISNYLSVLLDANVFILRAISIFIVIVFALLHIRSVKVGGLAQALITCIKILPFVIIIGIGIFNLNPDYFLSTDMIESSASSLFPESLTLPVCLIGAIAISSYAFDGMFAGCYVSGEISNPKKTLPRGLILTVLIVMVLYVSLSATATGLMPISDIANSVAPISDMAATLPGIGELAGPIIAVVAIIVIIGAISSCLLYMPRFEYAMAKDGLFFKVFSKVHPKFKTPYMAIILFAGYVIILTMCSSLSNLLGSLTIILLLKNLLTYAIMFKLRRKDNYNPTYKAPGKNLMPIIAIISMLSLLIIALIDSSFEVIVFNLVVIIVGVVAYFVFQKFYKK